MHSKLTEEEIDRLVGFFKILRDVDRRVEGWKERLTAEPEGFLLDGLYSCGICQWPKTGHWYTKDGIRCEDCVGMPTPPWRDWRKDMEMWHDEEAWLVTAGVSCTGCHLRSLALAPLRVGPFADFVGIPPLFP